MGRVSRLAPLTTLHLAEKGRKRLVVTVAKSLVDLHVHLAALPTADNGCYLSPRVLRKWVARLLLRRLRIDPNDPVGGNRRYLEQLLDYIRTSRWVGRAVLLALDGVYDDGGRLDYGRTHFLISNSYLLAVCGQHPEFLPGVSVNPLRRDALDELDRCAEAGAVLAKFLPNTQCFDPADPRCRPFYRRLAQHRLPLLSHTGHEFSLVGTDQSVGDPERLRPALEEGVTVISAHGGSSGLFFYEWHHPAVVRLVRRYPHYYLDSSALCSPNRIGMGLVIRRSPELQARLLYGSDYPVPVAATQFLFQLRPRELRRLAREINPLDKNAGIQLALGYRFADWPAGTRLRERVLDMTGRSGPGVKARE